MRAPRRGLDHAAAWVGAALLVLYGVGSFAGLLAPQSPDAIRDGMPGVIVFPAILSLYGAAVVLQHEHRFAVWWDPSWRGALTASWVLGWTLLVVFAVLGSSDAASRRETLFFGLGLLAILVVLPWAMARLVRRRSHSERAFLDS